jgi:hypothetical protein
VQPSQTDLLDLAHNANNLTRPFFVQLFSLVAKEDLLPDGIFVGEVAVRQCLADDHCRWRILGFALIEIAHFHEPLPV